VNTRGSRSFEAVAGEDAADGGSAGSAWAISAEAVADVLGLACGAGGAVCGARDGRSAASASLSLESAGSAVRPVAAHHSPATTVSTAAKLNTLRIATFSHEF